ncbi:MAG TPA: EamA family transporter [Gemmatimonadaceae bacterium]|jgi:drug/metabolite transporter (DMT)-like permease|nr:EamA family transporter [Gemmatimonadaceae bacterium]
MRSRLIAAFAAVYLVWGSTYLAIRFAVETLPPLLMAGCRFLLSGAIILAFARMHGRRSWPTAREWRTAFISGSLLLLGGNGGVVWAEQRVPSGIAALLVAVVPLWMVLLDWLRPGGHRPKTAVFAGVGLGLVGLLLLVGPDTVRGGGTDTIGALVLVAASLAWAAGSLYTKFAPRASSGMVEAGSQMLAGGVALVLVAALFGEPAQLDLAHASTRSLLGFAYLVTFGSLIGFTAYFYLLAHTTAAKAATYAYVNPVVAVFLGWALGHESVTRRTVLAAAVILAGVAIITIARDD